MKPVLRSLLLTLLLTFASGAWSHPILGPTDETGEDSLEVSLLTCAPGHQVYRIYGHTAIRVRNVNNEARDFAYNYGWFSFDTPNFILKFILGLTDYSMSRESTALFVQGYLQDDMPVTAQLLNLTPREAIGVRQALDALIEKNGAEHREYFVANVNGGQDTLTLDVPHWHYRYNFLYDNCTTRAVDVVSKVLEANGEHLVYPKSETEHRMLTQRQMIHEFTRESPWYEFGQDLLLGPEVDHQYTMREMTRLNFLPLYAQNFWKEAKIKSADGSVRPLVVVEQPLIPFTPSQQAPRTPLTPSFVLWALLGVAILLTLGEQRSLRRTIITRRAWRIWIGTFDVAFFASTGLVGVLLLLLVGWSQHPAVGTNWLLSIFSPLWLIYIPYYLWALRKSHFDYGATLLIIGAILYLVALFFKFQWFPQPTLAPALILLMRGIAILRRSYVDVRHASRNIL